MSFLSVQHLSLELKRDQQWNTILKDVNFNIKKGEVVGIVGESGSGKSITALSIMQLLKPNIANYKSGQILFTNNLNNKEEDIMQMSEKKLQKLRGNRIAMIFQEPMSSLNPVIKCGQQIAELLLLHHKTTKKEVKNKIFTLFEEVMLPKPERIYNAYPHELSGGQKQRVMIAMAMSCHPDLLIADEPTTALDVTVQKGILELIKKLQQNYEMSIIFISHDLGVIAEIADRALVLYKGEIVETGTIKNLFNNPQHPYTQGLLACRPPIHCRLKHLPTVEDFITKQNENNTNDKFHHEANICTTEERNRHLRKIYALPPILKINNLYKKYPIRKSGLFNQKEFITAVDHVSLDVYEGETLGIAGESGCGKTTLGRLIIQLIKPSSGSIIYKNQDLNLLNNKELTKIRKEIQMILQDPYSSLNQRITIGSAIIEPMLIHHIGHNHQERKNLAMELLIRVGLEENHFYRYPHEFSGGQRQRISIARALAVNPRFIICDESVSALDISVQAHILNLLNELKKEFQFTYIFISHDLSVVKFISDRIAVMQSGKIVEINEADELFLHPKTNYTKHLIQAIPAIK
jgi:peptide/nickel transport system ATP-binding protein